MCLNKAIHAKTNWKAIRNNYVSFISIHKYYIWPKGEHYTLHNYSHINMQFVSFFFKFDTTRYWAYIHIFEIINNRSHNPILIIN